MADDPGSALIRGPMNEVRVEGTCPFCGQADLVMRSLPLEIPYFGDALQTTVLCSHCTFRHADLVLTKEGPPIRYEMRVEDLDDLRARVVRSSNGTIRVPELGVAIEPGLRAEAFVSNAEGVLHRVRDVVSFLVRNAESEANRREAEARLARVDEMIAGRRPFRLVLEDPTGNSAILHGRARKTDLTARQAARLKRTPTFRVSG